MGTLTWQAFMPGLKETHGIHQQLLAKQVLNKGDVTSWLPIIWAKQNCQDTVP